MECVPSMHLLTGEYILRSTHICLLIRQTQRHVLGIETTVNVGEQGTLTVIKVLFRTCVCLADSPFVSGLTLF